MTRSALAALVVLALFGAGACGTATDPAAAPGTTTTVPTTSTTTTTAPTTTTTVDPGSLPQTEDKPAASGPQWDRDVQGLWQAIVTDDPTAGLSFFFPLAAYKQVKDMADPAKDHANRLIAYYEDDIHTLHRKLGADVANAQFVSLDVNAAGVAWIKPGVEYNKGAYWRVMQNTLRYTVNGQARSFPVVSMISWRGQWYVVHLSSVR